MEKTQSPSVTRNELMGLLSIVVIYLAVFCPILITQTRMFAHDTIWYYGAVRYYYNALLNGVFPFWDPYNYSGQPFYYNIGIGRIFEVPSLLVVFANTFVKGSLLSMYHWDNIMRTLLSSLGVYFCFREVNRHKISNFVVFFSFLFSSFGTSALRQPGILTSFIWTPWVLMFLLRTSRHIDLYNVIGLALFTGWSIASYTAGYPLTFIQLFAAAFILTEPKRVLGIFKDKNRVLLMLLAFFIVMALSLHVLAVFIEKDRNIPVLRRDGDPEVVSYTEKMGGCHATPLAFPALIFPARAARPELVVKGQNVSEGYLYIGIIPFLLSLTGMCFSSDRFKKIFLTVMAFIVPLMFGWQFKLGVVGQILFPFLAFARHMQLFQPFFILILMYFAGQGTDVLADWAKVKMQGWRDAE